MPPTKVNIYIILNKWVAYHTTRYILLTFLRVSTFGFIVNIKSFIKVS